MMHEFKKKLVAKGYIQAEPIPSKEELDEFYRNIYFKEGISETYQIEYSDLELHDKKLRAEASVEFVHQNLGRDRKISSIEIGCGEGFMLAAATEAGWNAHGVDYQKAPIKKFNKQNLDNFTETNPQEYLGQLIEKQEKFDLVILQNVLEHVPNPEELLKNLNKIISENGCIFLQVPNDYSPLHMLAMEQERIDREHWFAPPQHLSYFNAKTLESLLDNMGFDILDVFADFPIEMYLWGGEKNYTQDKKLGPYAHKARISLDVMLAGNGLESYVNFYRAAYKVGLCRNMVVLARPVTTK